MDDEESKRSTGSSVSTSNTQGWFDDTNTGSDVSSFQYMEPRAWFQDD
jgi:hypothetical protein